MDEHFTLAPGPLPDDYDGRPTQPWMLLVTEIDAATALLDHAETILRTIRFNDASLQQPTGRSSKPYSPPSPPTP